MTTTVHLLRHGEVHNPQKILYGRLPGYRLSTRGWRMAEAAAAELAGRDVAYLAVSPLQRAQETARPVSRALGLEIDTDERLLEAGNQLEGRHIKGWRSELWNPRLWPLLVNPTRPSWGEPYADIAERMWDAVNTARERADGREAVLVSHQLPIVMIQRSARDQPLAHNPAARQCELASLTSLVYDGDSLVDVRYSEPAKGV